MTLSPIPSTTAPSFSSAIPPATLRRSSMTSFGHLICAASPVARSTAIAVATPATSVSSAARRSGGGRSSTETRTELRAGASHARPIRPRPAVCSSQTATAPSGWAASSIRWVVSHCSR